MSFTSLPQIKQEFGRVWFKEKLTAYKIRTKALKIGKPTLLCDSKLSDLHTSLSQIMK